jgi:hypothetical protein
MDVGLLALLTIFCIFCTLGFGMAGYTKTVWGFALVTSLLWIAVPLLAAPGSEKMVILYSRIFQPDVARAVLMSMHYLLITAGIFGTLTCAFVGIKWFWWECLRYEQTRRGAPPRTYRYIPKSKWLP